MTGTFSRPPLSRYNKSPFLRDDYTIHNITASRSLNIIFNFDSDFAVTCVLLLVFIPAILTRTIQNNWMHRCADPFNLRVQSRGRWNSLINQLDDGIDDGFHDVIGAIEKLFGHVGFVS